MKQPIGMMNLQIGSHTFWTEPAFVNWKVITRLNTNNVISFDKQVHSALHCAIRAVSWHHTIDHAIRAPAAMRRVVKMRTKVLDDLIQMFDFTHQSTREP